MRAESKLRDDKPTIPYGGMSVQGVVSEALRGCAAQVDALSLGVPADTETSALVGICGRLFRLGTKMSLTVQFCLGDAHEFTRPYSKDRRELLAGITRDLGATYADRLRGFGGVAKRWPKDRRSDKYCWQYYKDHDPGVPGQPDVARDKKPIRLEEVSSDVKDGFETQRLRGRGGQSYEVVRAVRKPES